jgi:hypothetical protein
MIDAYTERTERWAKSNDLHVRMIEQAGEDRVLFQNTRPQEHVNMRFPEYVYNYDSPLQNTPIDGSETRHIHLPNSEAGVQYMRTTVLTVRRIMNVGSPYNVPAGSQVQMDKVIEKYRKIAYEDNERKHEALRNNEIKSEQPFDKAHIRKAPDML